jgi:hypothetical protein
MLRKIRVMDSLVMGGDKFQSLIGIIGNCNLGEVIVALGIVRVSIPDRDYR